MRQTLFTHTPLKQRTSAFMVTMLLLTIVAGDLSLLFTPKPVKAAYTGKQVKTIEYLLGNGSEINPIGDNVLSYAGSSWNTTKGSAGVRSVIIEGSGISILNAHLDLQFGITANVNIIDTAVFLDVEKSSSQGFDTPVGSEYTVSSWNGSGLTGYLRSVHDVTGLFSYQNDADWSAGIDVVAGVQVDFSAAANRTLTTAKLVITYESDYSSSAHTEVKTVRFPLDSTAAGDTGSRQAACAALATCGFTYYPYIPDAAADADILDVRFDMQAVVNSNASSSIRMQISGGTVSASSSWAEALADETTINVSFKPSVGTPNFVRNATGTLNVINGTVALNALGGELVVTYRYSTGASLQTETVKYYIDQQTATPAATRIDFATTTITVSNGGRQARNIWMKIHTAPFAAVTMTAFGKVGNGTERNQAYVFASTNPRSGDTPTLIFDLSQDAGTFSATTTTIAGGSQFSAANGTAVATEVYVTFTWSGSSGGAQTKSVQFAGGQQGASNLATQWGNWPVNIFLSEGVSKTQRSAYIESTYVHSEATTIALGTLTLGVNANTIAIPEAGDTEAYAWTAFYPIATTTFASTTGAIPWKHRVIEINESNTAADEGYYANIVTVTYDANFSQSGTTDNPKRLRTVEYLLGGESDNNTRATTILSYGGTSWNTVKATAGTKNIVLEGSNIRVKHAYVDVGFIVSNSANITNVGVLMDVEGSSSFGTDTRVGNDLSIASYNTSGLSGYFRSTHDVTALFDRQTDAEWAGGLSTVVGVQVTGPSRRLTTVKLVITYETDFSTEYHYEVKTVRFPLDSTAAGDTGARQAVCAAATTCGFTYYANMPENSVNNDIMDVFFEFGGEVDSGVASTMRPQISGGTAGTTFNWTENFANDTYVNIAWVPSVGGGNFNRNATQTLNILTGTVPVNIMGGEVVVTYRFPIDATRQTETIRYYLGQRTSDPGTTRFDFATTTTGMLNSGMQMKNIWMRFHTSPTAALTFNTYGRVGTSTERTQAYTIAGTNPRGADTPHIVFDLTQDITSYFSTSTDIASAIQFSGAGGAPVGVELFLTFTWNGREEGPQTQSVTVQASQQGTITVADWGNRAAMLHLPESVHKDYRSSYLQTILTHSQAANITTGTTTLGVNGSTTQIAEAADATSESFTTTYLTPIASSTLSTSTDLLWKQKGLIVNNALNVADEGYFGNIIVLTYDVYHPYRQVKYTQNNYHFYADHGALRVYDAWATGSSTGVGENGEITASDTPPFGDEMVRLRMSVVVSSTTVASSSARFKLQYAATSSSCGAIATSSWNDLGDNGSLVAAWRGTSTPVSTGTPLSTNPFTSGDLVLSTSNRAGTLESGSTTRYNLWPYIENEEVEYDWAISPNPGVVATSTRYCFRMVGDDGTPFWKYTNYPAVRTAGFVGKGMNWRWYDDQNNETPTTALAAENTAPVNVAYNNAIKLRLSIRDANNTAGVNQKFKLQFSESSTFTSGVYDVTATSSCTLGVGWCYADGVDTDGGLITTRVLTDSAQSGTHNEAGSTTSAFTHTAGTVTEYEFTIKNFGATPNTVYFFRAYDVVNTRPVTIDTGETYPSLSSEGATLSVIVAGIGNASSTEGITTTGTSTATSIPFGTLAINATSTMGQRITVTTNAPRGYTAYVSQTQGLLNQFNDAIPGVTATNSQPLPWNSTCLTSAKGCFGYHAGDDSLDNSTRFLANDTWAQLATSSREIMYNSGPVPDGEFSDIIYRLYIRSTQQSGAYSTAIIYTVIPTF